MENQLLYGDNLDILRDHIADESVDLIYIDPPFNSNRNYNVLFKEKGGEESPSQIEAFTDTWVWNMDAEYAYNELTTNPPAQVANMIEAMRSFIGTNDMMAYLVMMAQRIKELHRVLKATGSIYLHCDPTASHYLKVLLDTIFGARHFKSEIIWKRTSAHSSSLRFGPVHDVILAYTKSDQFVWNQQYQELDESYIKSHYSNVDAEGRRFTLSDLTGSGIRKGVTGRPWKDFDPTSKGRHWVAIHDTLDQWNSEGLIYWPKGDAWPRFKRYLDERKGTQLQDVWTDYHQ